MLILLLARILALTLIFTSQFGYADQAKVSIEDYMAAVREQSPSIAVSKSETAAVSARAVGIRLEAPMVGYMQMRDGAIRRNGFELSQQIPFPSKITKERQLRSLQAQSQNLQNESVTATILADARLAFVSYWASAERVSVIESKKSWLQRHSKIAKSSGRYNTEGQIYAIETQAQEDETENELLKAQSDLIAARNELKLFAPEFNLAGKEVLPPPLSSFELQATTSPAIETLKKQTEEKKASESLAKIAYAPDLFVRYRTFEEVGSTIPRNEELMVGLTLPFLYFWQHKAEISAASADRLRGEALLRQAQVNYTSSSESLLRTEQSIRRQLENLNSKILPRSEQRVRLVKNISQRTMQGLAQTNSVMLSHYNLKLSAIETRLQHERTIRDLSVLTGETAKTGKL